MGLRAPTPRRERILVFGVAGSGKSSVWLAIAEWIYKSKSDSKVWVIDTDVAWDAMRPEDGHLDEIVEVFPIYDWVDYKPAVHKIRENGQPDDWYVLDRGDVQWSRAQEAYAALTTGQDVDEFFLAHAIAETSPGGDYGSNWTHIRRMYAQSGMDLVTRFRGNVLVTAAAKELREDAGKMSDDPNVIAKYHSVGYKPEGKADLPHLFHTEIYMVESPSGYRMTTLKDRKNLYGDGGRKYMKGKEVKPDFVMGYLIGEAGWKI
jgi:hypothetical protein